MAAELRWRAMGSAAHVVVVGGPDGLAEHARRRITDLESRWSRFLPDSEISRLNQQAGSLLPVSSETLLLLSRAREGRELSAGAFDATVLAAVVGAGYDRDFADVQASGEGTRVQGRLRPAVALGRPESPVEIRAHAARLEKGSGFDPGGIGKGLAADLVFTELLAEGAEGACVNLGGDLRVGGSSPEGTGWTVGVEHAWSAVPIALLGLESGGVATSTTLKRRWNVAGEWRHHLIDPRSGLPSDSDLHHVTVLAAEAWVAEVLAKAVLLNGSECAFNILGGSGGEALAVDESGRILASPGFAAYLGDQAIPERVRRPGGP